MKSKTIIVIIFLAQVFNMHNSSAQNNALHFDGDNDKVDLTSPLVQDSDFTIEAWFIDEQTVLSGDHHRIIGWTSYAFEIASFIGILKFYDGVTWRSTGVNIRDGLWHHVAVSREGSSWKCYLDGVLVVNLNAFRIMQIHNPFSIGGLRLGSREKWLGKIDEVRIWNKALLQSDIQNIMGCNLNGNEPFLVGYYNFDQGIAGGSNSTITTLIDNSPNANNGDLMNFSLSGNTSNWVSSGAGISGECTCDPTTINFTYSFVQATAGQSVEVTWDSDCFYELMDLYLVSLPPLPFQNVQVVGGIQNSGSFNFTLDPGHESGDYQFYLENNEGTIWKHGPSFMVEAVLPVRFQDFSGNQVVNKISIEFKTQNEVNNRGFFIQSNKGEGSFSDIGWVDGTGNSKDLKIYHFTDHNPTPGINYYRLKQIDFDGNYEYSDVISVYYDVSEEISVFPNPVATQLNISGIETENTYPIYIFDITGRLILKVSDQPSIDVSELDAGLYFLTLGDQTKQFIKL